MASSISFNVPIPGLRMRVYPGDTQLFRPLLFAWLSGLKACFGGHFEHCQLVSIVVHGVICVLLFILLRRLFAAADGPRLSPFIGLPFALTFFFALNYAIVEQVVWFHIQPYMVATALILGSVLLLLRGTEPELSRSSRCWCLAGPGCWRCSRRSPTKSDSSTWFAAGSSCSLLPGPPSAADSLPAWCSSGSSCCTTAPITLIATLAGTSKMTST